MCCWNISLVLLRAKDRQFSASLCLSMPLDATYPACCVWLPLLSWFTKPQTQSVSHLILVLCLDLRLPLLPQQLLDSTLERLPEVLKDVVTLLLLLVLTVFLMTLGVMDVVVIVPVLLLVVLVVAAPQSKWLVVGCSWEDRWSRVLKVKTLVNVVILN